MNVEVGEDHAKFLTDNRLGIVRDQHLRLRLCGQPVLAKSIKNLIFETLFSSPWSRTSSKPRCF